MIDEDKKPDELGGETAGPAPEADPDASKQDPAAKPAVQEPPKLDPAAAAAALAAFEDAQEKGEEPAPKQNKKPEPQQKKKPGPEKKKAEPEKGKAQEKKAQEKKEPAAPPPVVRFDHVTKTYNAGRHNAFTALKDIHFTVEDLPDKGEFICLLGPSGCGKSTILRLIAGLEPQHPPTEGTVEIFGKQVEGPGADRGMVFQSYTSFDNRTVLRNLVFGLECQGVGRQEREELAREWIDKVGLSVKHDADKYPHQLSGGMQQRVAIARTLILHPKIILMDEPFGALDPVTRVQMQDLLVSLWRDQEGTVFFVTHSIAEAVYLGDRCYLLSSSPGTILREVNVPPPDRPAIEMQKDAEFQEVVYELSEVIHRMEREQEERAKAS